MAKRRADSPEWAPMPNGLTRRQKALAWMVALLFATMILSAVAIIAAKSAGGGSLDRFVVKVALPNGHGTGVVIGDGTYVLTAAHVAQAAPDGQVLIVRQDSTFVDGRVIWIATTNDIALIRIEERLPAAELECTRAPVGSHIEIVGHPYVGDALNWMHTYAQVGKYSSSYGGMVAEFLWFGGEVYPGNSGGPIFNEDGKVVGIVIALLGVRVSMEWLVPFGYNIAVPADVICGLMP